VDKPSAAYLAGIVQYFVCELIEMGLNHTKKLSKKRLGINIFMDALKRDQSFSNFQP
jgi:hypothetical protein